MNDARRQELELFFDGELPAAERSRVASALAADPEAVRYLDELRRLRLAAQAHEPQSAGRPARPIVVPLPARHGTAWRWVAAGAAAAATVLGVLWWNAGGNDRSKAVRQRAAPAPVIAVKTDVPSAPPTLQLDLEAQSYEWANGEPAQPADAARIVLGQASKTRGRPPAKVEILALELANASPGISDEFGRFAAERVAELRQSGAGTYGIGRRQWRTQ